MAPTTPSTTPNTPAQAPSTGATSPATTRQVAQTASQVAQNLQQPAMPLGIERHPLFVPRRPIEDMEFPPKKIKPPKAPKEAKDKANDAKDKNEKNESKEQKESSEKSESKKDDKEPKKKKPGLLSKMFKNPNISYNPLSRGWHWGKSLVQGAIAVPGRVIAKAAHVVGRPQQLFEGEARSDVFKNSGRGFANLFRGITGGIYKPHRTALTYENVFKDYGGGRGPKNTKNPAKLFCWAFGKFLCPVPFVPIPKIASHIVQTAGHFLADTASGKFDYTHTSNAIKKAVEWDHVVGSSSSTKSEKTDETKTDATSAKKKS